MSNNIESKSKIARKYNINLFGNQKIDEILSRRPYPPGQHGKTKRSRPSEYKIQLDEKQKTKYFYGLSEEKLNNSFKKASSIKGNTADNLIDLLERRLDVLIYRAGLAPTISASRQLVSHGHFKVNDRRVNVASMVLDKSDEFRVKQKTRDKNLEILVNSLKNTENVPEWIEVNKAKQSAKLVGSPIKDEAIPFLDINLVVEFYSK